MRRAKTAMAGRGLRLLVCAASSLTASWLNNIPTGLERLPSRKTDAQPRALVASPRRGLQDRIERIESFGRNPGQLRMSVYAPSSRPAADGTLIVLLHGCGQDAASFAANTCWIDVARRLGIVLVLPEQVRENNRARCFNWFEPEDVRRGGGEAASIRQMVRVAVKIFHIDPKKVFIVGLSAGGAMAAAMLAAYPSVFKAGAVVAGMPVGSAHGIGGAILRMHHANGYTSRARLAEAVRSSSPARRSVAWPRISIWQGGRDRVLDPANAIVLAAQFSELHGGGPVFDMAEQLAPGISREVWGNADRPAVELWQIAEMGHGFPIDTKSPNGGRIGPDVFDVGLSAAEHMARFFGIGHSQTR